MGRIAIWILQGHVVRSTVASLRTTPYGIDFALRSQAEPGIGLAQSLALVSQLVGSYSPRVLKGFNIQPFPPLRAGRCLGRFSALGTPI